MLMVLGSRQRLPAQIPSPQQAPYSTPFRKQMPGGNRLDAMEFVNRNMRNALTIVRDAAGGGRGGSGASLAGGGGNGGAGDDGSNDGELHFHC